jgi:hypothetical protein
MADQRLVEIFSAGCPVCEETIQRVRAVACPSCDVMVRDMKDAGTAARARDLGVARVPAIAIDGALVDCCTGGAPVEATLRAAGLGQPLS